MIRPQRYFPWKVARELFLTQFAFVFSALALAGVVLHLKVSEIFVSLPLASLVSSPSQFESAKAEALSRFDQVLVILFTLILFCGALYLLLSTRYYASPLGRLIQRARELRRQDASVPETQSEEDEYEKEPGEWADLERALGRIHLDLRLKTEAHEREREELSTLIGAVSDAILAVDRTGLPLFFNAQFSRLFSVQPIGVSERPLKLGEIFRVSEVLGAFEAVLQTGKLQMITATMYTRGHAGPRHFSISIAPLQARDSQLVYGAVAVFHDVTELKQSEQIRIEFVGNASHELRTPLTSIKGYVETLRDDLKIGRLDGAPQFLDIISRNVDRLIYLVNDLLDLSVIESGAELTKSLVSTREVTDGALRQLERKRKAKDQEIMVHYQTEHFLGDARRIEQVLVNLIHNAIKYIPEHKKIEVFWEAGSNSTQLRVKDNGQGISPEHQARLFERFYRVDTGRSRDQGGTGLGLAIVKHIMLKHGGSVRLQSQLGQGSEFICSFPDAAAQILPSP